MVVGRNNCIGRATCGRDQFRPSRDWSSYAIVSITTLYFNQYECDMRLPGGAQITALF